MQRYSGPRDALHIRHRGIAVEVRAVPSFLADDAEHAERGRMAWHARRHGRACDQRTIVINRDPLVGDRDDDLERALWSVRCGRRLRQSRLLVPGVRLMPKRSRLAPPRLRLWPEQELGVCRL